MINKLESVKAIISTYKTRNGTKLSELKIKYKEDFDFLLMNCLTIVMNYSLKSYCLSKSNILFKLYFKFGFLSVLEYYRCDGSTYNKLFMEFINEKPIRGLFKHYHGIITINNTLSKKEFFLIKKHVKNAKLNFLYHLQ